MSSPNDFARLVSQGRRKDEQIAELEQQRDELQRDIELKHYADMEKACAEQREQIARQILVVREMSPDLPEKKGWEDACDAMLNMLED